MDALRRRALVVEDDPAIRELLRLHLSLAGFHVDEIGDGRSGLECARAIPFDLIVLDLMLPSLDGLTLCRAVRTGGPNRQTAILMLTAKGSESDKVLGLESGADDYVTKPFGMRELIARIGAVTRRSSRPDEGEAGPAAHRLNARGLVIDPDRREVIVRGGPVELTRQEFDLLYLLAARPGIVFSRPALIANVWGGDTSVTLRSVDVVVSRLRRKIETDAQHPELVLTSWGTGYKFADGD
jgi:DNA-binding response OmpR family regulator